jgi:uncharacterized protein
MMAGGPPEMSTTKRPFQAITGIRWGILGAWPTPGEHMQPTSRIVVLDVLRAFALFGIIVTHAAMGFLSGRPPKADFMSFTPLDQTVNQLVQLFFSGKFFTIFSFLFGLSFAIQLANAERKGGSFAGRYAWRLLLLALIALIHGAFFSGDILIIYAVLGFLLIPVRSINTKVLAAVGVVLVLNIPGLVLGLAHTANAPPPAPTATAQVGGVPVVSPPQRQFDIKARGSVGELIHMNLTESLLGKVEYQVRTGRGWMTFGLFLLGLCAGRLALFNDTEANRAFFRKLLIGAGVVAFVTTIIAAQKPPAPGQMNTSAVLVTFSFSVQQASLSAVYLAIVTLLFWRKPTIGLLPQLAPMGKMGLTTYLVQTVFGATLFFGIGFGMLGHLGVAASVAAGIAFFAVQVVVARWWMARFNIGPVEWLWRTATYLKWQPITRGASSTA